MHMIIKYIQSVIIVILLTFTTAWTAVQFDGVDDYIDMGTNSTYEFPDTTFTVVSWFKATVAGYIVARRYNDSGGAWFFRINSDGTGTARLGGAGSLAAQRITTTTALLDGNWHHLAVVFTTDTVTAANNSISIYIDGVLDQGSLTDQTLPYQIMTRELRIGVISDLSSGFITGTIDDVRIYSVGLSAENVDRLYKSKMKYLGLPLATVSYWPLDDCNVGASGDAVTFNDRAKGGSNGTGVDGANNTGLTCAGSSMLSYPPGTD